MNRSLLLGLPLVALLVIDGIVACPSHAAQPDARTSLLWGEGGERWDPAGRLTDFSYAGYHRGERPLPGRNADVSVKDFGAVGDGKADDTAAFQRAVKAAGGKVIAIPPGRYVITDIIDLDESGTVLQGAGPQQTTLYVPVPLEKIRSNMGATTGGRPTSNYSWSGGILWARGSDDSTLLAKVTAAARRGETELAVDRPERFSAGDFVRLDQLDDTNGTMTAHQYGGDPGDFRLLQRVRQSWTARVVSVDRDAKRLVLDRPLRTDVRPAWQPTLYPARSSVEEVGIEHLAFEFPVEPYMGHFTELGYNAIAFTGVRNSWVRNIEIRQADSGMFISGGNNTVTGVTWISDRRRDPARNATGHHGITLSGTDLLLDDFDFRTKFIHDITMSRGSAGNVVMGGRGEDLTFDHHKYANHANLFTDIDAGVGTNIFMSGGGAKLGRHCGAWTTWWNIRTQRPVRFPAGWAPDLINLVGVVATDPSITDAEGRWFEVFEPGQLAPQNLYEAQRQRRLGTTPTPGERCGVSPPVSGERRV
jgi:hypothetical protein